MKLSIFFRSVADYTTRVAKGGKNMTRSFQTLSAPEFRIYDVELSTPLGKRSGSLRLSVFGARFCGTLDLMKAENAIRGQTSNDGSCRVTSSIRTRMSTYRFEGEGRILPERIELLLRCGSIKLPLRGTRKEN